MAFVGVPEDSLELRAHGLTTANIQEIAGSAAHELMNTIFTTVANTGLREE